MPRTLARMSTSKRVIVAAPRGYCAGVDRAVTTVEKAIETYGPPIYVRKQIVHNKHVVSTLEKRGAIFVDELDEVPADALVVFSAHGVSPAVREEAARRELRTIDATCPLVTKVHREAKRFAAKETDILLIGHAGHEEVEGTMGEAPDRTTLLESPDDVDRLDLPTDKPLVWLSQTTLSVDETMETVTRLRQKFPLLVSPPTDDICYATQNRQQAVKQIAPHCDLMIVVGSRNSSNSMRLVEVALEAGAKRSERIDYPHEIRDEWLDGVSTIGLTSGASVPDELVQGALALLRERGFPKADEERLIEENLTFALPPELRRDLGGEDQRRSRRHPGRRGDEAAKKHEPLDVGAD
ncbi:4-hydroxy-3-methylbut-2-enyl diphosphate reductase [Arachnia propionica F0230a]|nr:4-hydroxy-3-methylbut-2-enyl diphosphate reductase [Arachnia propionica F0230a]